MRPHKRPIETFEIGNAFSVNRLRMSTLIVLIFCCSAVTHASQLQLEPQTTGTYSWDWFGSPLNLGAGFGKTPQMIVGGKQQSAATRNYRSYMVFDTLEADAAILTASLELTIEWRKTDSLTTPNSKLAISLGLPTQFTAEQISYPYDSWFDPTSPLIYNDLATNPFASMVIPFGDVDPSTGSSIPVHFTIDMPYSFISAFNQARASSTRYLTVSFFGGDFGVSFAGFASMPILSVNTLTPVPEPLTVTSMSIGLSLFLVRSVRKRSNLRRKGEKRFSPVR